MNEKYYLKRNSFIYEFEKERKLLELQQKYEEGTIKESDLSEEEKSNLMKLYKKQIEDLQKDIEVYKRSLQGYKEKILKIRKKL